MDAETGPLLLVGTYERFLLGFRHVQGEVRPPSLRVSLHKVSWFLEVHSEEVGAAQVGLHRSFTIPAHKGVIHTVTAQRPFLVSGGGDEQLHVYNFQGSADLGTVLGPGGGGIYAAALFSSPGNSSATHLLSGAADGSLSLWQTEDWTVLKTMTGHSKAVTGLTVHNSGRVALSTARDGQMRMWNCIKGKPQYKRQLGVVADDVQFLPGGDSYALMQGSTVTVHSTGEQGLLSTLQHPCRVGALAFLSKHEALVGAEDGSLRLWDMRASNAPALAFKAHHRRLRGIVALPGGPQSGESEASRPVSVASCSSDGTLRLWDMRQPGPTPPATDADLAVPVSEAQTQARITCMCCISNAELEPCSATEPPAQGAVERTSQRVHLKPSQGVPAATVQSGNRQRKSDLTGQPNSKFTAAEVGIVNRGIVEFPDDVLRSAKGKQGSKRKHSLPS